MPSKQHDVLGAVFREDPWLAVNDPVRERVLGCQDSAQLDEWLLRAVTVESAEDVFG